MDYSKTAAFVAAAWGSGSGDGLAQDAIERYIAVPNASPDYDDNWATNGHQEAALQILTEWVAKQNVQGLQMEVIKEKGRTPLLFMSVAPANGGSDEHVTLMYGHFDKQPPLTEDWDEGLGPYTPVIRDGKLYGRGGADDGYSTFAAVLAIKAIQDQGQAHPRIAILIEGCEESGSPDLEHYVGQLTPRLGDVRLIICLDSGCGDYDHFWITNSLRGLAVGTLRVRVLKEGMHSGAASGVVPSSFRIARHLLDRIEDSATGEVKLAALHTAIPDQTRLDATAVAAVLGDTVWKEFPFVGNTRPMATDNAELLLNKTWRPTVSLAEHA